MLEQFLKALGKRIDYKKMAAGIVFNDLIPAAKLAAADTKETSVDDSVVGAIELLANRFLKG